MVNEPRRFEITASAHESENRVVIDGHDITDHVHSFRLAHSAGGGVPQLEVDLLALSASVSGSADVAFYPNELRSLVEIAHDVVADPTEENLRHLSAALKWIEWMVDAS